MEKYISVERISGFTSYLLLSPRSGFFGDELRYEVLKNSCARNAQKRKMPSSWPAGNYVEVDIDFFSTIFGSTTKFPFV